MSNRRKFIIQSTLAAGTLLTDPLKTFAFTPLSSNKQLKTLSIFTAGADAGYYQSLSKFSAAKAKQASASLVVSTGNIIDAANGNKQQHLQQLSLVREAGCDIIAPGNSDLSNGAEYFHQLTTECNVVTLSNLNGSVSYTSLLPYSTMMKGDVKVGIIGEDHSNFHGGSDVETYAEKITRTANFIKTSLGCNLVVAVSSAGSETDVNRPTFKDKDLASLTEDVDIMISKKNTGKTFGTYVVRNTVRKEVIITCSASEQSILKVLDISFNDRKEKVGVAIRPAFA